MICVVCVFKKKHQQHLCLVFNWVSNCFPVFGQGRSDTQIPFTLFSELYLGFPLSGGGGSPSVPEASADDA